MTNVRQSTLTICVILLLIFIPLGTLAGSKLDFDDVLQAALRHSYDVRASTLDIGISESSHRQTRSLYYPELSARLNSQYVKDLTGGTPQVTAVGTTVLLQNTMYQNSLSLNAAYNLYDFGARENRILITDRDIEAKRAVHAQSVRDAKLKVLEIYRDLLLVSMELKSKKELLSLYKELSLAKERLFTAGRILKVEMVEEAIKVVKTVDAIDNLKLKLINALQDLSFHTGDKYDADNLEVSGFKDQAEETTAPFDVQKSPEFRIYDLEIEKKKAELEILRKERFPQFSLYSNYILYGQDQDKLDASMGDLRSRNFFIGLMASMPLFDGFKNSAQVEKARLEMERLKVEKEKKLAELINRYDKLQESKRFLVTGLKNQEEIMAKVDDNLSMVWRLAGQKVAEYAELLARKIETALQKHELARTAALKTAALVELQILSEVQQ
jgi:outer membrane protein